ncbi:MAG: helix-turn-helix domain-containing protein [Phototrophicaceae bacterium]|jgi:excisionase family DNA binding protein
MTDIQDTLDHEVAHAASGAKLIIEPGAVYSRQEAATALGISLSTLKRLIKKGYLRVSKPNGMRRVFITGESILAMLNDTTIEAIEKGA